MKNYLEFQFTRVILWYMEKTDDNNALLHYVLNGGRIKKAF